MLNHYTQITSVISKSCVESQMLEYDGDNFSYLEILAHVF